jgi:arylsulfatase A-like enzyme
MKGNFYEGGIRVPLIARWPGHIQPGAVSEHVCAFWDFLPTLTEVAHAGAAKNTDGVSFLPTLLGRGEQAEHPLLYWEHPHPKGIIQAARQGNWKAVRPQPGAALELYDLASDVGERHNLAAQQPQIVEQIEALMAAQHTPERKYEVRGPEGRASDFVR